MITNYRLSVCLILNYNVHLGMREYCSSFFLELCLSSCLPPACLSLSELVGGSLEVLVTEPEYSSYSPMSSDGMYISSY